MDSLVGFRFKSLIMSMGIVVAHGVKVGKFIDQHNIDVGRAWLAMAAV
jgi:hypothetical protein